MTRTELGTHRWKDTLPPVWAIDWMDEPSTALYALSLALASERGDTHEMLDWAARAATVIRAWRTSLGVESIRWDDCDNTNDRALLRIATREMVFADGQGPIAAATCLRIAEAALRTLWRRHQDTRP